MRLVDADVSFSEIGTDIQGNEYTLQYNGDDVFTVYKDGFVMLEFYRPNSPIVEVNPIARGNWVEKTWNIDGEESEGFVCSLCGADKIAGMGCARFCYICGSDMREEIK